MKGNDEKIMYQTDHQSRSHCFLFNVYLKTFKLVAEKEKANKKKRNIHVKSLIICTDILKKVGMF